MRKWLGTPKQSPGASSTPWAAARSQKGRLDSPERSHGHAVSPPRGRIQPTRSAGLPLRNPAGRWMPRTRISKPLARRHPSAGPGDEANVSEPFAAYGLGARVRRSADHVERARKAVSRRVRDAMNRVAQAHPPARTASRCFDPHRRVLLQPRTGHCLVGRGERGLIPCPQPQRRHARRRTLASGKDEIGVTRPSVTDDRKPKSLVIGVSVRTMPRRTTPFRASR
jgi:hypothetical protein